MPAPGEPFPLPNPRRARRRAGEVLSLPSAASVSAGAEAEVPVDDATAPGDPTEAAFPAPEGNYPRAVPEVRRRRRPRDQRHPHRPRRQLSLSPSLLALLILLTLGIGAASGWLLGGWSRPAADARPGAAIPVNPSEPTPTTPAASADTAEEVENAYAALEAARPLEARDRFLALAARADPGTRAASALRAAAAWSELAAGRTEAAEGLLVAGLGRGNGGESADTRFLLGITRLMNGDHAEAEKSFARAAALDPTRSDVHLLWGDTQRREGHLREGVAHFRAALRRNRQEVTLGFYQLKLWLSQLQAGGEPAAEAGGAIDAALLQSGDSPAGTVLLGAAARALGAGSWPEAADLLRRARRATEPAVFATSLQDPLFVEQSARPELAEFFAPAQLPPRGSR